MCCGIIKVRLRKGKGDVLVAKDLTIYGWKVPRELVEEFNRVKKEQGFKTNTKTLNFIIRDYFK